MNFKKYPEDKSELESKYLELKRTGLITKDILAPALVNAHLDKAVHNLKFVGKILNDEEFNDWTIVGLYYTVYHAALALIAKKGFFSKSHEATLVFLLRETFITQEEAELLDELRITKEDAELYAQLRTKRKQASYSTNILFSSDKVRDFRERTILFLNKAREMVQKG